MAVRIPLVIINGQIQQLPSGDTAGTVPLGSGTTAISSGSTATLGTFTRSAGSVISVNGFVTDAVAGAQWQQAQNPGVADKIDLFLERTATANQFSAKATNRSATSTRTIDWKVFEQ